MCVFIRVDIFRHQMELSHVNVDLSKSFGE